MSPALAVDTVGRRFHVEWDPLAAVTPFGQLVFFSQFLATSGLYSKWVADCLLRYISPNAPSVADVLGTSVLANLSGACRYAHVTALRGDQVNPQGLGMHKVVSEDSLRRAFQNEDPKALEQWQTQALLETCAPALDHPWIADLDVTVKPIYGHQEGAELGCNPHKPGRPSHAYHTVFLRTLRVALDVEVHPGKEHAAADGLDNLWRLWDRLTPAQRPWLICGDAGYGNERIMKPCEERKQSPVVQLPFLGSIVFISLGSVQSARRLFLRCPLRWKMTSKNGLRGYPIGDCAFHSWAALGDSG